VTGYADTTGVDNLTDAVLLTKPFRMNELAATIELALSRGIPIESTESTVVPLGAAKRRLGRA
jgi:DNA-binding response OmpR family regulator